MKSALPVCCFLLAVASLAPAAQPSFKDGTLDAPALSLQESIADRSLLDEMTTVERDREIARPRLIPPANRSGRRSSGRMPIIEPDPSVDFRMAVITPDESIDYKMLVRRLPERWRSRR